MRFIENDSFKKVVATTLQLLNNVKIGCVWCFARNMSNLKTLYVKLNFTKHAYLKI
ncbi:hypothetical protein SAMN05216490_1543 [Mucilaginibacter mallensis]|uniref:Uncharacterized protein n=1 Tax=Mucilaginibacter mallensis TaxID=652787 RepID=A0A1H1TXH0_MUCMA|nr:hypothetical protein SAMN05216490_1543 [Mucilaginibacter mallensis]